MIRRRYTVVIVGLGGMAHSHRSEVSRHRSERDALTAAAETMRRLGAIHGDGAVDYRVLVERDGFAIEYEHAGRAADHDSPSADARTAQVDEGVRMVPRPPAEPEPDETPEPAVDETAESEAPAPPTSRDGPYAGDIDDDFAFFDDDGGHDRTPHDAARELPDADDEHQPTGPVPDDVLRKFEAAIAREERRRARHTPGDRSGGRQRS